MHYRTRDILERAVLTFVIIALVLAFGTCSVREITKDAKLHSVPTGP